MDYSTSRQITMNHYSKTRRLRTLKDDDLKKVITIVPNQFTASLISEKSSGIEPEFCLVHERKIKKV